MGADLNGVVADSFIDLKQFISPFLCSIFNHIFNTDIYPEARSNGAIIPIDKKATQQTTVELLLPTQWIKSSHFYSECVLTNGAKLTAYSMIPNMVSGIIV